MKPRRARRAAAVPDKRRLSWVLGVAAACVLLACIAIAAFLYWPGRKDVELAAGQAPTPRSTEVTALPRAETAKASTVEVDDSRSAELVAEVFRSAATLPANAALADAVQTTLERSFLRGVICAEDLSRTTLFDVLGLGRSGCWRSAGIPETHPVEVTAVAGPLSGAAPPDLTAALETTWEGDQLQMTLDWQRAQAHLGPGRPFEWKRFLVKDVGEEVVFSIGAEVFEGQFAADHLVLKSTSFRGERTLYRAQENSQASAE